MVRKAGVCVGLMAVLLAGSLPVVHAGKTSSTSGVSLVAYVYNQVIDEQNTTAFYNNGTTYCDGLANPVQMAAGLGDSLVAGPNSAFSVGSPWTAFTDSSLASTAYTDGADCGTNCLQVQLTQSSKTFTIDDRGTAGPSRTLTFSFATPCGTTQGCPGPAGSPTVFGGAVTTAGLLSVFLDFPYTSMAVCSSTACPEAQPAYAKFWFTDSSGNTWRIDWSYLRVLRVSSSTWYIVGDSCDGTQVAGLSELVGSRTQPKTVFNGYYEIPFYIATHLK